MFGQGSPAGCSVTLLCVAAVTGGKMRKLPCYQRGFWPRGYMRGRVRGFDGLRALAVSLVVLEHKFPFFSKMGSGGFGVHLFFVLSGFLIIGILHSGRRSIELQETTVRTELLHFYENRLFRIWPIYFLLICILVLFGTVGIMRPLSGQEFFALVTFTSNLFQGFVWPTYPEHFGAMWSVAVEEQFYLWAAPLFLLIQHRNFNLVCLFVMALAVAVGVSTYVSGLYPRSIYVGSLTNFGLMALGGIAVIAIKRSYWLAKSAPFALLLYLACPALVALAIGRYTAASNLLFWGSGLLVAVVLVGIVSDQSSWMVKVLEMPPVRYLGTISYGVYLYHGIVGISFLNLFSSTASGARLQSMIEIAISITVASASWHFIERPLLNYRDKRRLLNRELTLAKISTGKASSVTQAIE
jgi:peptidoglycan/LPS O-acetylase OafA/YrhL